MIRVLPGGTIGARGSPLAEALRAKAAAVVTVIRNLLWWRMAGIDLKPKG
jgi:hypothetical protein